MVVGEEESPFTVRSQNGGEETYKSPFTVWSHGEEEEET